MPLIESPPDAAARIYARSLFSLIEGAGGREGVEAVLGELEEILELARADARFGELLSTPAVSGKDRAASLERIFRGRIGATTLNFLQVLSQKGRLAQLPSIVAAFDSLAQEKFGRVEVDVYTAEPLPADGIGAMRDRLSQVLGKDVVLHPYTDGSMIGGVKFRIGDQLVDASVATRLRKLKDQLDIGGAAALRSRLDSIIDQPGL